MSNGIRIHLVEAGKGPLVLMVHGFPESWYSWRHQLHALADAGYRAAAIDVRGYGRSSAPAGIDEYRMTKHVADNLGAVEALGEKSATIVGHDWGAPIAANSALLRPDVFRALALLSVPYSPCVWRIADSGEISNSPHTRAARKSDWTLARQIARYTEIPAKNIILIIGRAIARWGN